MRPEMSRPPGLAGVVLAAGRSSRMPGRSKLLRSYGGEPVVRRTVRTAMDTGLVPVIVVVGHAAAGVREALAGLDVTFATVPVAGSRRLRSLAAGLRLLEEHPGGAMVLLADEPGLGSVPIEAVRQAWIEGRSTLLRPSFRDRPGHPVLIGRSLFSVVHEIARDAGPDDRLWERLLAAGAVAEEVPIEDTAPVDIDSPAHLRRARARMRKR